MSHILIVAPHPDDEVLGCGGVLQRHVQREDEVHALIVTDRVIDHRKDEAYIQVTRRSASEAAAALGLKGVRFGGLPDEQLDRLLIDVIVPVEVAIRELQPDVVYVPWEGDSDQDHRAVSAACRVAARGVRRVLAYEVPGPSKGFDPNWYVELTEDMLAAKIAAFLRYAGEDRPYPHPRSAEGLRILAQYRGMQAGFRAAEGFRLLRESEGL